MKTFLLAILVIFLLTSCTNQSIKEHNKIINEEVEKDQQKTNPH